MNIAPLNISSINSNLTSSTQSEFPQARNSATSSGQSSYSSYQQICNEIVKTFLEIRQKTTEENQSAALLLRKTLPIDVEEKRISMMEPITLLGYIKQMFSLVSQMKAEVERELSEKKDSECSDYEAMLQKLEAEVRQHIRIEQQLKLYIETTQSKLDDLEKARDSFNPEVYQQQIEKLKGENGVLTEKLKKRDSELDALRKELKGKLDIVHSLELQVETIPILKNKIRDLEKATTASQDLTRASATLNMKNLNTSTDIGGRPSTGGSNQGYSSSSNAPIDLRARKTSQQYTANNFPPQDNSKFKTVLLEKNKENIENMKIDLSKKSKVPTDKTKSSTISSYTKDANERTLRSSSPITYEVLTDQTNIRNNQRSDVQYDDIRKSSISRQEPKVEMRQSVKERPSYNERDIHEERTSIYYNSRQSRQNLIDEAELNTQKSSIDRSKVVSRQKDPEEEFERLQSKVKRNMSQERNTQLEGQSTLNSCKRTDRSANDAVESPIDHQALKKYIPKPSKTTMQSTENQGYSGDLLKGYIKKEASSNIDIHKLKVTSPKKSLQDSRSQSVDATNKYYRTLKSKAENTERPNERDSRNEYLATTKTSGYPPQNNSGKLQGTLSTTQNLSHLIRMNS